MILLFPGKGKAQLKKNIEITRKSTAAEEVEEKRGKARSLIGWRGKKMDLFL